MPILKQSPVSHSKKRPRLDRAMISAPLGDFRHTMHIGRGGDAFGDTSFLSNHGGSPEKADWKPPNGEDWDLQQKFSLESPTLDHAESLLSFQLDLGPSILDDVLGVMDKDWDNIKGQDQEVLRDESPMQLLCTGKIRLGFSPSLNLESK
uniref:CDC42 effector protein 5 n=1 Tax=Pseudonaja textilis TaxID=8673 RepID=A0A670Z441_PSETE